MNRNPIKKVILLGDSGVGKTSLMNRYVNEEFSSQYKATIGADFIWDTAGQERYQSLGAAFFRGSDACILVFDVTSVKSFNNLIKWKEDFMDQADMGMFMDGTLPGEHQLDDDSQHDDDSHSEDEDFSRFPFCIIGNKVDLTHQRMVDEKKVEDFCRKNGNMKYYECSAKDGTKVKDVFEHVAFLICERYSKNMDGEDDDEENLGFESFKPEPYKDTAKNSSSSDGSGCNC